MQPIPRTKHDSLLNSLDSFLWEKTRNKINRSADIVLFADEASNAARSEMLGVFLSYFDEGERSLGWISFHL